MRNRLRYWLIRRVLKSAAAFEENLSEAYSALLAELKDSPAGARLERLQAEEKQHLAVIRRLSRGPAADEELERLISPTHFHNPDEVAPLDSAVRAAFAEQLERLRDLERDSYIFYSNLARMSKIQVVKKSFSFLADQEREHLQILQRLLGGAEAPETAEKG
jgi:rubrerythrin